MATCRLHIFEAKSGNHYGSRYASKEKVCLSSPFMFSLAFCFLLSPLLCAIGCVGISTASGIPDYRGPQGSYRLGHVPIKHADFISSDMTRKRYWMRSMFGWPRLSAAQPNPAHHALALFERNSFLSGIVTQNVDGLHQQAGCTNVIDLHGRIDDVICLQCKSQYHRSTIQTRLSAANPKVAEQIDSHSRHQMRADGDLDVEVADYSLLRVPCCVACGGILKPNVVFFGDNVPISRVEAVNSIVSIVILHFHSCCDLHTNLLAPFSPFSFSNSFDSRDAMADTD